MPARGSQCSSEKGCCQVSRFTAQGVAAANFGPGALRSAHSRNEATEVKALEAASAILERFLTAAV